MNQYCVSFAKSLTVANSIFTSEAQKKGDTGKDEGGPSRQFLTDVFKQLGGLSISLRDKTLSLFEHTSSGVMVATDEMLNEFLNSAAQEEKEELLKQARDYARAIGRISK